MRSLLSVYARNSNAFKDVAASQADAIIINLERRGTESASVLRHNARNILSIMRGRARVFVQVSALHSEEINDDLEAIMEFTPKGILLPVAAGTADVEHLAARLRVFEALQALADGQTKIIPLINSPSATLAAASMRAHQRIAAVSWMPFHSRSDSTSEDIMGRDGKYFDVPRQARTLCLLVAGHLGVPAIDAPFPCEARSAFYRDAKLAWRDGFHAKIVTSEDQVIVINDIFRR